jgi:hypothetical protein
MLWSECKTLAQGFLHRTDIDLDSLQPLALADINVALVVQENESGLSATLADEGNGLFFAPLPADYATIRAVDIGGVICDPVDYKTLRQHGAGRSWYAISGMELHSKKSGQLEMLYTTRTLPAGDGDTNVVLDRYPQAMLYGVLKHAAIIIQDYDAGQVFDRQFMAAIADANAVYMDAAFGPGMAVQAVPGGMI